MDKSDIVDVFITALIKYLFLAPINNPKFSQIISGNFLWPNPKGGSEIPSIHRDPLLGAFDPSSSTFLVLSPALILFRAGRWIYEYTRFGLIID